MTHSDEDFQSLIDDPDVLRRIQEGDEILRQQLHHAIYQEIVTNWPKTIPRAIQATFTISDLGHSVRDKVAGKLDSSTQDIHKLRGYIYRTAENVLKDELKKAEVKKRAILAISSSNSFLNLIQDSAIGPEATAISSELREVLSEMLTELSDTDAELLRLRVIEEMPWQEVAEQLQLSVSYAKQRFRKLIDTIKSEACRRGIITPPTNQQ